MNAIVLKFGSSVLRDFDAYWQASHEIDRHIRAGRKVVAVVSAPGDTTDDLTHRARRFTSEPSDESLATILSTGETSSASWLALSLQRVGITAQILLPSQLGLRASGSALDANLDSVDRRALHNALHDNQVLIVPGFYAHDSRGRIRLLGRGGSDLSALFLARELGAGCALIKDVDGLFEYDPALPGAQPRQYAAISWSEAARLPGEILQSKAIQFARQQRVPFRVQSIGSGQGTQVGDHPPSLGPPSKRLKLRVGLLGAGTVGGALLDRLRSLPAWLEVVGLCRRNPQKTSPPWRNLVCDVDTLFQREPDVIVELVGGTDFSKRVVERALDSGIDVVSANKELIAVHGPALQERAARSSARLKFSASVGGVVPMIDTVARITQKKEIQSIRGILNGTTNAILDTVTRGSSFEQALREAQERGFAEEQPDADINGTDAYRKLVILARTAFGNDVRFQGTLVKGIESINVDRVQREASKGRRLRLIATVDRVGTGLSLAVRPVFLNDAHPLAQCQGAENILQVSCVDGSFVRIRGQGAGGDPTAQAVLADLDSLCAIPKRSPKSSRRIEPQTHSSIAAEPLS